MTSRRFTRRLALLLLCAGLSSPSFAQPKPIEVAASTAIMADLVRQIGGERVRVRPIVAANADPHDFEPTPNDARQVAQAKLVVINGLGFEPWADRFLRSANFTGERLVASRGLKALSVRGSVDPHAWQDVENMRIYVANIRDALVKIDPAGEIFYQRNAANYQRQLDGLHAEIKRGFAAIPPAQRKVVTSHDAFNYFADAYGVIFLAPQGVSSHAQPSAQDMARLIRQIRDQNIRAIFFEQGLPQRVLQQITAESGARIGGSLYADTLDDKVTTYIDMIRHNARTILAALR